jgi:hypothetical protein
MSFHQPPPDGGAGSLNLTVGSQSALYPYQPIDSARETRLLHIIPADDPSHPIQCRLSHTLLENADPFIAVSYAWGDRHDTRRIELEGHLISVTSNLYYALQSLRSASTPAIVWADAVCINQSNISERNAQVTAMARIFAAAESVAVHLGPESSDSGLAMQFMRDLSAANGQPEPVLGPHFLNRSDSDSRVGALVRLFERDYWNRHWVVQEIANARELTISCGSETVSWDVYVAAMGVLDLCSARLGRVYDWDPYVTTDGTTWAGLLRLHASGGFINLGLGPYTFLAALDRNRMKMCADPRDKVYGILGLLSDFRREQIGQVVDYNLGVAEVYIKAAVHIITSTRELRVLLHAFPSERRLDRLPSWVPDWSHRHREIEPKSFHASAGMEAKFYFSKWDAQLTVSAVMIDTISTLGVGVARVVGHRETEWTILEWLTTIVDTLGAGEDVMEAFCRAICRDICEGQRVGARYTPSEWKEIVLEFYARRLRKRYPRLQLDPLLQPYLERPLEMDFDVQEMVCNAVQNNIGGQSLLITDAGHVCLGSGLAKTGDIVCVPLGCHSPIILRRATDGFKNLGAVYVDQYMDGRAIEEWKSGHRNLEEVTLI